MTTYLAKKFLAASLIATALTVATAAAAPLALADQGSHSSSRTEGSNSLGEGARGNFRFPNGAVTPLGCFPGSSEHPCARGNR
ncbi:hypothetical protein ACIRRA_37715 [Nocardia sp. NPDC101769]|uniref:hypothetical protein n=1 Tax=Nocardia sp. NPDC101769 TaxID=3364333 RepID=UPI00382248EA